MPAVAADYPTKAYDATYNLSTPQGKQTMKMLSDGKGHLRTETTTASNKVVSIMDYINKTAVSLIDKPTKMAVKTKLTDTSQAQTMDDAAAKKLKAESLGQKVVAGHPCKGWKYKAGTGEQELWVGDDTGCTVKSILKTPQGTTVMELEKFQSKAPSQTAFEIPSGYKVMSY